MIPKCWWRRLLQILLLCQLPSVPLDSRTQWTSLDNVTALAIVEEAAPAAPAAGVSNVYKDSCTCVAPAFAMDSENAAIAPWRTRAAIAQRLLALAHSRAYSHAYSRGCTRDSMPENAVIRHFQRRARRGTSRSCGMDNSTHKHTHKLALIPCAIKAGILRRG
jgi:hypothetical protein